MPRFTSALRSPWSVSRLGLWLALAIGVCFATGLYSHALQHPAWWFTFPTRPVSLYRVTQGVHVATGLAAIPLLAAKLWSVYPRLFDLPPVRGVAHALERAGIAALVAGTLFEFVTGVLNVARAYGLMPFYFPAAHYRAAWLVVGGLLLHVAVKLPLIREALTAAPPAPGPNGVSRRALFGFVGAAGLAVTAATLGQTLRPLAGLSVLAPRDPRVGPQGLPVNRTAAAAGITATAGDYRLEVAGPARTLRLSLADLAALPQHTATLPIACVEGWSANGVWTGVRVTDLVRAVGGTRDSAVTVESLQRAGRYRVSTLDSAQAADPLALLALRLGGQPLHPDHGYPLRLIAPNRPGVLQTKWIGRIEVSG